MNWTVLADEDGMTLIDSGYPGNAALVDETLAHVSKLTGATALEAILITHGHTDHIGNVGRLVAGQAVAPRVMTSPIETSHVRRDVLHQVGLLDIARRAYNLRIVRWALHAVRSGGLEPTGYDGVTAHEMGTPLDVPGRPVALSVPGHTPGHTAYHLPRQGLIVSGDALVTSHPTVRTRGPQVLLPMFNHDDAHAHESVDLLLRLGAGRFLPGHGPVEILPRSL